MSCKASEDGERATRERGLNITLKDKMRQAHRVWRNGREERNRKRKKSRKIKVVIEMQTLKSQDAVFMIQPQPQVSQRSRLAHRKTRRRWRNIRNLPDRRVPFVTLGGWRRWVRT